MFSMSMTGKSDEPLETLYFDHDPMRDPLGVHTDTSGVTWHCRGRIGRQLLAVRHSECDAYFTSTTPHQGGIVSQSWRGYLVEILTPAPK